MGFRQSYVSANVVGRLVSDPKEYDVKGKHSGRKLAKFCLAVNYVYSSGKGETAWIDYEVWGAQVEFVMKYLKKGMLVAAPGDIKTKIWTDSDGVKHKKTFISPRHIIILGAKGEFITKDEEEEVGGSNESRNEEDDVPF